MSSKQPQAYRKRGTSARPVDDEDDYDDDSRISMIGRALPGAESHDDPFDPTSIASSSSSRPRARKEDRFAEVRSGVVTDARGQQRLHGAFTGGFSAGYFNSVGSIKGFTPAGFVSSRTQRATAAAPRPEDYMDDEDRSEAASAGIVNIH